MAFPQNLSAFSSMSQVLEAIDSLFAAELKRTGSPWVSSYQLTELFLAAYKLDLEKLIEQRGYGKDLRYFLTSSRRFSIYSHQPSSKYYLAPLKLIVPGVLKSGRPRPKLRH
ncbi:hypothetical protein VB780_15465 [Leptolyngbya sp. CCNP1308]|uniref:hypothetical protein n=1 Tax=Leptolyngbya sp. CCNP1308 TaxID=3110255 RepID=UPI002B1EE58C|nr:hypothetical protein [Leptolyngbya sp. CCNP1308]MEA5449978.1 hypothetical protein [Leptolyngbya sp. CCNP1308]